MNRLPGGLLLGGGALGVAGRLLADRRKPTKPTLIDPAEPVPPIDDRIEALRAAAQRLRRSVRRGPGVGPRACHTWMANWFAMCSTFKGYAAARVLQKSEHGELSLDRCGFVDPATSCANSPVTGPRAGHRMTLAELCQAALQRSDNTAGNLLLRTIGGPPAITAFARTHR